jgi:hypothetical protein
MRSRAIDKLMLLIRNGQEKISEKTKNVSMVKKC